MCQNIVGTLQKYCQKNLQMSDIVEVLLSHDKSHRMSTLATEKV